MSRTIAILKIVAGTKCLRNWKAIPIKNGKVTLNELFHDLASGSLDGGERIDDAYDMCTLLVSVGRSPTDLIDCACDLTVDEASGIGKYILYRVETGARRQSATDTCAGPSGSAQTSTKSTASKLKPVPKRGRKRRAD